MSGRRPAQVVRRSGRCALRANAVAGRLVGTLRREGVDHLIRASEAHRRAVPGELVERDNATVSTGARERRADTAPASWSDPRAPRARRVGPRRRSRCVGLGRGNAARQNVEVCVEHTCPCRHTKQLVKQRLISDDVLSAPRL